MAINFLVFDSVANLKKYIDQTIAETKTAMGVNMRSIDEIKKKLKSNPGSPAETKKLDIAGFRVLVNPTVEHELQLMEETFTALQDRLDTFEGTKELYPHMTKQTMKVGVVLEDGIPSAFMFDMK